jgi:hypothetical protein
MTLCVAVTPKPGSSRWTRRDWNVPKIRKCVNNDILHRTYQCCGSGSGIRCFFTPRIRDPGWSNGRIRIRDPG